MHIHKLTIPNFSILDLFLKAKAEGMSLLHSAKPDQSEAWSILAWSPSTVASSWHELKTLHTERRKNGQSEHEKHELPFCGGGIGTFDYGFEPRVDFRFYDHFLCYKHAANELFTTDPDWVQSQWAKPQPPDFSPQKKPLLNLKTTWPKASYLAAFQKIQDYILSGDIYQINLTQQLAGTFDGDPKQLFKRICETNPAPMAAYLDTGPVQVLSASPERFLKLKNGQLTTTPVKGTRPRGQTPQEDELLKKELLSSEKEQAELSMITDLLRNDLGQVAKPGTVTVQGHHALQINPSVFHTYSRIEAEIREDRDAIDLFKACLPGGSISGCPKKRACEIIKELEPLPRGLYTGALAYLSDDGQMDSSILIRTLLHDAGRVSLGVGGGIVADSNAENEYQESLQKALTFLNL